MITKRFPENLFAPTAIEESNVGEFNDAGNDAKWELTCADGMLDKPFLSRRSVEFRVNNSLAERLEQVTEELRSTLPPELQPKFNFNRLGEICLAALVDEYDGKADKTASVLCQIVAVWRGQNETNRAGKVKFLKDEDAR